MSDGTSHYFVTFHHSDSGHHSDADHDADSGHNFASGDVTVAFHVTTRSGHQRPHHCFRTHSTTELPVSVDETDVLPGFAPTAIEITTNVTSATTQALNNDMIDLYANEIDGNWSRTGYGATPDDRQNSEPFVGIWRTGSWAPCSKSCGGGGRRMRSVLCYDLVASMEIDPSLCPEPVPPTTEECANDPCPIWVVKEWSVCSATCGKVIYPFSF